MVNLFKIAQDCSEIKPLSGGFNKIIIRSKSSDSGNMKNSRKLIPIREKDDSNTLLVIENNFNNGDSFIELLMDMLAEGLL